MHRGHRRQVHRQVELDRERKAITRLWAKREQQLNAVIASSAGLYGDPQGIAGNTMPEIERLDLLMIEKKPAGAG